MCYSNTTCWSINNQSDIYITLCGYNDKWWFPAAIYENTTGFTLFQRGNPADLFISLQTDNFVRTVHCRYAAWFPSHSKYCDNKNEGDLSQNSNIEESFMLCLLKLNAIAKLVASASLKDNLECRCMKPVKQSFTGPVHQKIDIICKHVFGG